MKKPVLALGMLGSLPFASEPVIAQSSQNGPYYANPSWDRQLPDTTRFIVLLNWNSAAVLDRVTVWCGNAPRLVSHMFGRTRYFSAMLLYLLAIGWAGGCRAWRNWLAWSN